MHRTYKYRIYPSKSIESILTTHFETCKILYNSALSERRNSYKNNGTIINLKQQINDLANRRKGHYYLNSVYAGTLKNVLKKVDKVYQNFFEKINNGYKAGYPRFKTSSRYNKLKCPRGGVRMSKDNNFINFTKIGDIKIKYHRPIEGRIRSCIIEYKLNKWYVHIDCYIKNKRNIHKRINNSVGIDFNLRNLLTASDGFTIKNPRWFKQSEDKINKMLIKYRNKVNGSNNKEKAKNKLLKLQTKVHNQRLDYHHKVSRFLVDEYRIIIFENLNITGMLKNKYLAESIHDAAWNQLISLMKYKAEEAGAIMVEVNPRNTTKTCNVCGAIRKISQGAKWYRCNECGLIIDRDWNSAINIKNLGLKKLGQGLPEVTPVKNRKPSV